MKQDNNLWRVKRSFDVPISIREQPIFKKDMKTSKKQSTSSQIGDTTAAMTSKCNNTMTNWNQERKNGSVLDSECLISINKGA